MSEPRRWKDSPDAPVGMRELLSAAQKSRSLDDRAFRRGQGRVAKLGIVPAAAAAVGIWVKLAAAGVVGIAATTAVAVESGWHPFAAPTPAVVAVPSSPKALPAPPTPAALAEAPEVEPASPPAAAPTAMTPADVAPGSVVKNARVGSVSAVSVVPVGAPESAPVAEPAPSAAVWTPDEPAREKSTLADELPLLEEARRLLARSPETAIERLRAHRARYPAGVLATERDIMELDALRRIGRVQDVRDRALTWLARDPNGIHSARLRAMLASME